ncbi:uncharacterized protein LOC124498211 [Dermatophagoides farinae]|uniref:uncharacterized protein LOC124498211 n=1 Tax=Dermatophagoides farinae TaxID=6954 RepID=UPI003F5F0A3A
MILIVFIYVWWWLMLGLCSVHCSPEFTNGNEPQSQQNKHNNNNNNNKNDSWIIYSFQSFDHNPSKHNEIDMRIQNIDNNPKKNLTPSETLLYHGYIPPVNHLEDPNGISENEKRVSDEPTTEFYHSSIYDDILKSNDSGMIGETKEIQNPPDSIQDLLEPAEARSTNLPEDDPSEDNSTNQSPDDDEDFGPDPVDDDTDVYDEDSSDDDQSKTAAMDNDDPEHHSSNEDNIMTRRSDDDDYDQDDDDDRAESNRDEVEYTPIMLDDDDDNNKEDDDEIDREDFGDGGETQKIDSEIIMPQIFLWSNPIETINDDPDENGEKEDDFNLDETQFDQEYPDMLDPQASSPMETSASVKHEITNQTNMFVPIHDNTDNNANIDNNTANVEAIVTGETIIIK